MHQKNKGRWKPEEHQRFLEALKLYGKDWNKISRYIGTRDVINIRSHAQKFFKKISNHDEYIEQQETSEYINILKWRVLRAKTLKTLKVPVKDAIL